MRPTSVIRIDLAAIDANIAAIRRLVGGSCRLCPIVKADAYGLGAARIARRLAPASHLLAVYSPQQAVALAEENLGVPILVLMPIRELSRGDELYRPLLAGALHATIHDESQLRSLARSGERLGVRVPVHVEVDVGLRRGGVDLDSAGELLHSVLRRRSLRLAGVMTHFSDSKRDPAGTAAQLAAFDRLLAGIELPETCLVHVSSTHSLLRGRRFHRGMVRFGLAWAGYGAEDLPEGERLEESSLLRGAVTWSSEVVHAKRIPEGSGVGYGSTWIARRPTTVGLVPVGYADGFPTTAGGRAELVVSSPDPRLRATATVPVIGAVSMDQITVDLTDLGAAAAPESFVGWGVEVVGADRARSNYLPAVASRAGCLPHELLCRMNPRLPRVHVIGAAGSAGEEGAVVETLPIAAARAAVS